MDDPRTRAPLRIFGQIGALQAMRTRTRDLAMVLKPWQWEVLEASIRYEILFADNSRRCWLDDIHERAVTDPQE
ncbi:MAG: hypothetical protein IH623_03580 [Verrucomicrobia bacterium]|nr:hypothetical protein [Verrucomicrobiota bacterium]